MESVRRPGPLAGITVVERAQGAAAGYAGRLFAVMGARVVMAEPPEGTALRREPPMLTAEPTLSALFAYLGVSKESIVAGPGEDAFADLLDRADVLIDDTPVDERPALGLDPETLLARWPRLIYVSVLPFGATGPRATWRAHEINVFHAGGEGYLTPNGLAIERHPDRPPVKVYGHFAHFQGGTAAATAAIAALLARPTAGGQFIDISVQDANVAESAFALQRHGDGAREDRFSRSFRYGGVIECADGFVEVLTLEARQWDALVALLGKPAWSLTGEFDDPLERGRRGAEINEHLRAWARRKTVADVVRRGQALGVPVGKYNSPAEVLVDPHMQARRLFQTVALPGVGDTEVLVAPFRFSTSGTAIAGGPPALGRHQALPETPLSRCEPQPKTPRALGPLSGLRVADFTLHAAGPFSTHLLSQLGAECIKIESAVRLDIFRKPHPVYGRMQAATFDQVSSNKLSITLNLKDPRGIELAKALVAKSDVVAESFRPGVMERLGLGYDVLRQLKPEIVMLSVSSCGQTGPDRAFAGYAPLFGAWGGLGFLTGYADGPPVEIRHIMDHSVGMSAAFAAIAAIWQQRSAGVGQHVDVAAREVASSFIGDALLRAAAGETPERSGNHHPAMAPHGVYPCEGRDSWVSIAVGSEREWQGLVRALRQPALTDEPRFATAEARHRHAPELDGIVTAWTRGLSRQDAAARLQEAGVPACPSMDPAELANDPHLRARGTLVEREGVDAPPRVIVNTPFHFSRSSAGVKRWTPGLGQDNDYVYGELLGLSEAEQAELKRLKVIH